MRLAGSRLRDDSTRRTWRCGHAGREALEQRAHAARRGRPGGRCRRGSPPRGTRGQYQRAARLGRFAALRRLPGRKCGRGQATAARGRGHKPAADPVGRQPALCERRSRPRRCGGAPARCGGGCDDRGRGRRDRALHCTRGGVAAARERSAQGGGASRGACCGPGGCSCRRRPVGAPRISGGARRPDSSRPAGAAQAAPRTAGGVRHSGPARRQGGRHRRRQGRCRRAHAAGRCVYSEVDLLPRDGAGRRR